MQYSFNNQPVSSETRNRGLRLLTAIEESVKALPSAMARLVFLSGLRDPNTGIYRYPMKLDKAQQAEVDGLLRRMHAEAFACWLNFNLARQMADLDLYFSSLDCPRGTVTRTWLNLEPYRSFLPASATSVERQLFVADLDLLLRSMDPGVSKLELEIPRPWPRKPLLTTQEISQWLGIAPRTVRLWAETHRLVGCKVGRQWRFPREDFSEWVSRKRREV